MSETTPSASWLDRPIHRHWINLVWRALAPGALSALAWLGALLAFLSSLLGFLGLPPDLGLTAGLVLAVLSIGPTILVIITYYDWVNDHLIISRDQIAHYEQHYIFSHRTQTVPIRQIQNVGIYVPNILCRWLDVGHVFIDTAGTEGAIRFTMVQDPHGIQSQIFELMGRPAPTRIGAAPTSRLERLLPIYPVQTERGGLIWHRHWIVLLRRITLPLLSNLALLGLLGLWYLVGTSIHVGFELGTAAAGILALFWALTWPWLWYVYQDWKNDYWIVTDTHIIYIVARPFPVSTEDRRQARLEDIQDVRTDVPSLFDRLIRKGNVFAETAGRAQNFELTEVMNPESIQREIFQRRAAARARAAQELEQARLVERQEFERQIMALVEERLRGYSPPARGEEQSR